MSPQLLLLGSPGWAMVEVRHSSAPVSGSWPGDEAAGVGEPLAAVDAADHDAVGDDRRGGVREALRVVGLGRLPDLLAGAHVDGDDRRVVRREEHLVAVEREAARGPGALERVGRVAVAVLPDEVARGGVDGLDDVAGVGQEHHPVVHERRRLVLTLAHREHPGQLELAHVLARDLVERAVALVVARAAPGQPVVRGRLPQQLVGDRRQRAGAAVAEPRRAGLGRRRPEPHGLQHGRIHPAETPDQLGDLPIGLRTELALPAGRHLGLEVLDQLVVRTRVPRAGEARPRQRRTVGAPFQPHAVALRALRLVRRRTGHVLRGSLHRDPGRHQGHRRNNQHPSAFRRLHDHRSASVPPASVAGQ